MYTKTYYIKDGIIANDSLLSTKTNFLSANDIYDISRILQNQKENDASIAFIDFKQLPQNSYAFTLLQLNITNYYSNLFGRPTEGQSHCTMFMCNSDAPGFCVASESQNGPEQWWCLPTEKCVFKKATPYWETAGYAYTAQDSIMTNFKRSLLI